jgi:hypothetical protein
VRVRDVGALDACHAVLGGAICAVGSIGVAICAIAGRFFDGRAHDCNWRKCV